MRRFPIVTFSALLLVSLLAVGVKSYPVKAIETIYIRVDDNIDCMHAQGATGV